MLSGVRHPKGDRHVSLNCVKAGGELNCFPRLGSPQRSGEMIMQFVNRRRFIGTGAFTALSTLSLPGLASATKVKFKIGVTDWNLKLEGRIESISLAKRLGFDGVQISIGKGTDKLPLSDPALQKAFLDESEQADLKIESLCLEILHRNFLK